MGTKRTAERETFLAGIITTAVEGGVGYWAAAGGYRWWHPDIAGGTAEPAPAGGGNAEVTLYETEAAEPDERGHLVTLETVAHALSLIRGPREIAYLGDGTRKLVRNADRHSDGAPESGGDIDSAVADQIVQIGIFGRVVYG